jgi:hypothetical protein
VRQFWMSCRAGLRQTASIPLFASPGDARQPQTWHPPANDEADALTGGSTSQSKTALWPRVGCRELLADGVLLLSETPSH